MTEGPSGDSMQSPRKAQAEQPARRRPSPSVLWSAIYTDLRRMSCRGGSERRACTAHTSSPMACLRSRPPLYETLRQRDRLATRPASVPRVRTRRRPRLLFRIRLEYDRVERSGIEVPVPGPECLRRGDPAGKYRHVGFVVHGSDGRTRVDGPQAARSGPAKQAEKMTAPAARHDEVQSAYPSAVLQIAAAGPCRPPAGGARAEISPAGWPGETMLTRSLFA